ncbi:hypothetical protein IEQ34_004973 [Dendrobium chrysotoxum]|uniref:Uncharacterized protein n=1 Tax=Dendrobium chrysotoxum TaxID=161865 RepID=A0AAV7HBK8_DENCH|nr:hypothetical protein IEQ34_004973 [Dendrobium chrysotoxum]
MSVREGIWERNEGMGPEREFQERSRIERRVRRVMEDGMLPVTLGSLWKLRVVRKGRSPTAGGMGPVTLESVSTRRAVTREPSETPGSHTMPPQSQHAKEDVQEDHEHH